MTNEIVETHVVDGEYVVGTPTPTKHQRFAANLRILAEFYEMHPDIELPHGEVVFYLWPDGEQDVPKIARAMGKARKGALGDTWFTLERKFGELLVVRAHWSRESVCKRTVVGQKSVQRDVPTSYRTETVLEDVVEWECPKILPPRELAAQAEQAEEPAHGA